jgi:SSS family solute:Na+ symporter
MTATLVLLALYAGLLVAAGFYVSRRVKSSGDFFVAGRQLPTGLVFTTLLAANIGAGSTVGAAGLAYTHGLSAWWWSGSAALGCLLLGLLVAPRLHRLAAEHGFLTVGDFLEWRFDRSVRGLVSAILWVGTLSILAGQLIAMAWALEAIAGVPKPAGCLLSGLVLIAYFSAGGLLAAAWVNLLELAVLVVGFLLAVPYAWSAAGGWPALSTAGGTEAAVAYGGFLGMGPALVLGLLVTFVPSFAVSPGLVQKTYGARTPASARAAVLWNALALAAFAFVPALLGMAARATRPDLRHAELALPTLLAEVLPPWIGGLGLAALFAAEISTADAVLFMLSTSLSQDLYKTFVNRSADDARLLRVSRWTAVGAGLLGIGLALLLPTVADALKAFYGVMTVALFVPVTWGLLARRGGATAARLAVAGAAVATVALLWALAGRPSRGWLPYAAGLGVAAAVFAAAAVLDRGGRAS